MTHAIDAEGLVKVYRSRRHEVRALDGVDLAPLGIRRYRSLSR